MSRGFFTRCWRGPYYKMSTLYLGHGEGLSLLRDMFQISLSHYSLTTRALTWDIYPPAPFVWLLFLLKPRLHDNVITRNRKIFPSCFKKCSVFTQTFHKQQWRVVAIICRSSCLDQKSVWIANWTRRAAHVYNLHLEECCACAKHRLIPVYTKTDMKTFSKL